MATHSIDIPGLLRNSLSVGVSITDALSEEIDNSLSAGSTKIRLNLSKDGVLIISDDGCGMDQDKLEQSCRLHSRTTASSEHHGRFGFGSKQAEITLTNLEGPVTKFSSVDGNGVSQITVNYPKILQTGVYYPQAGGIQRDSQHIWEQNAINPLDSGTITCIHLSHVNQRELSELIMNERVTGLRFKFATTYRTALTQGVKLYIQMGDIQHEIYPIDLMCSLLRDASLPPTVHFKHETHEIDMLQNTINGEIVVHVMSSDGTRTCLDKSCNKFVPISEESMGSLVHISDVTCSLAYSTNWNLFQKDALGKNGIAIMEKGKHGIREFRTHTNGTELVRNGKIIKYYQAKCAREKNSLKMCYEETRTRIEFVANEQTDTIFNVQVNKSQVNEDLINRNVLRTIDLMRQNFIAKMLPYKEAAEAASVSPEHDSETDSESVSSHHSSLSVHSSASIGSSASVRRSSASIGSSASVRRSSASIGSSASVRRSSHQPIVEVVQPVVVVQAVQEAEAEAEEVPELVVQAVQEAEADVPELVVQAVQQAEADVPELVVQAVQQAEADVQEQALIPNIVPNSREVRQSVHQSITRAQGEAVLEHWLSSNQHMATLNETHDDLISAYLKVHDWVALNKFRKVLNKLTPVQKHELLIDDLIQEEHPLPENRMFKGIELFRTYSEAFGTNAHVHL
jgi:hypothetical protein